jgi:hypothetical protein
MKPYGDSACNPTFTQGDRDQEDQGSKPAPGKWFGRRYLKNIQYKTGLAEHLPSKHVNMRP